MNKVKNKKIIRKIADRTLKVKKSRNLIGILAIVLTSLLFTGVFTIGGNLTSGLKNMYGMIGGMLAFILALIGILNFLNTTAASILSRKQEFYAEKIIANAGSFALAIILFFGIYEVTVIFGFT